MRSMSCYVLYGDIVAVVRTVRHCYQPDRPVYNPTELSRYTRKQETIRCKSCLQNIKGRTRGREVFMPSYSREGVRNLKNSRRI